MVLEWSEGGYEVQSGANSLLSVYLPVVMSADDGETRVSLDSRVWNVMARVGVESAM
jgi:hypothetical protein